jgi:hypothetical protein
MNSSPFAANPNGSAEIISADSAAAEQKLQAAVDKVLLEFYGVAFSATKNLTSFMLLLDQVAEHVPEAHPLERARALFVRLNPSHDNQAIADSFSMGALVATSLRHRGPDYKPAVIKKDEPMDFTKPTGDAALDAYFRANR